MKHAASRGAVRIIAGRWRRRRLPVVTSGEIRPTPDRVREALFNWLGTGVEGTRCLDLFAGTGALGFESASRGARAVVLVERDRAAVAALELAVRTLGAENVTIECADALRWMPPPGMRFDVVFLDPPWFGPTPEEALARLDGADALAPGCVAYLETERDPADIELPPRWRLLRTRRAGRVRYHLASRNNHSAGCQRAAQGDD